MDTDVLARAQAVTRAVLASLEADQFHEPTPCESWTVRDLINHVIAANHWFARSMNAGRAVADDERDYAARDFLAAFDESSAACVAAFDAPGALDKIVSLPFGELPGSLVLWLATSDVFVHGWDLAKATGHATDLDAAIAEELLIGMEVGLSEDQRGSDFGPRTTPPQNASAADRLAAFLGRDV